MTKDDAVILAQETEFQEAHALGKFLVTLPEINQMGTQIYHIICDPQRNFPCYLVGETRPRASKLNIQLAVEARAIAGRDIDQSFVAQREDDITGVLEEGGAQLTGAEVVF